MGLLTRDLRCGRPRRLRLIFNAVIMSACLVPLYLWVNKLFGLPSPPLLQHIATEDSVQQEIPYSVMAETLTWPTPTSRQLSKALVPGSPTKPATLSRTPGSKRKMILYWTPAKKCDYLNLNERPGPTFEDLQCPENNCFWTADRTKVKEADAVLFFQHCIRRVTIPQKNPHGRWILVNHESPCESFNKWSDWDGLFNWTMRYTKNSDIYSPYARVVFSKGEGPGLSKEQALSITKKKTKLVAWMVSHCPTSSRREEYVEELQKYIPVDVYGRCGPLVCARGDARCHELLNNDYKFYLAFENSFAESYVTEKFFYMIPLHIIPVTRSLANYSELGVPPILHIDTRDFKSPKDLAEYLKRLDKDDESYAALLRAKADYKVFDWKHSYCDICRKLNDPSEPTKWYSASEIIKQHGSCFPPTDL
ncbi:alpha-(1,3)-fucosyltransferase C isoform X2 [Lingula anatina]|nr:alpha-(1,3)-fucosyltransferase C isoform X2 [Lingula anatina]|eukprot:XP_013385409.1 alpha-(1,3)-fucosyltransferase C isoform X2 [Lingula anatina]